MFIPSGMAGMVQAGAAIKNLSPVARGEAKIVVLRLP
jgi:hypothetical protein